MSKVIAVDNFNRDYQPERLITVSISTMLANVIANNLNQEIGNVFYKVVEDSYELNTLSMYDITDVEKPSNFEFNQYGLSAIPKQFLK